VGDIDSPATATVRQANEPNFPIDGSVTLRNQKTKRLLHEREPHMISFLKPSTTVYAHCDLPCGVYDPAQAKIEALSVKACMEKYAANSDADFRSRSVAIKEQRSHQVKEHLWVLWTDYFKPNHFEAYPQLHTLFNDATKLAGAAGTKGTQDVAVADKLIAKIDEIAAIFWETKK
jgi:nickel superoxide dismutase